MPRKGPALKRPLVSDPVYASPRTKTIECSCKLCPTPGMYAVTSIPEDKRTRATFLKAEFGFFGVVV